MLDNLPGTGAKKWIPLVSLYSGMRLGEVGQLAPQDIKKEHYRDAAGKDRTVYVMYATDEGDEQRLKNNSSRRRIPVHQTLVDLGFINFVQQQKGPLVFSELTPDNYGRLTAGFSRSFGYFLRNTCKITDTRKAFHSFRHLFKDTMREMGVREEVSDALSGHSNGSSARGYGGDYYPLRPLVEAMAQYQVHGVRLPPAQ